ncbi:MAG TPA: chemotaxis protein CheX [Bryobacteraceae bacterium]
METLDRDKLIGSMRAATQEVFATMLGLEIAPEEAYVEANSSGTVDGVVALIGLAGNWVGGGIIHCDVPLARKLYKHFLMAECEPAGDGVNEEVLDAIAEIANMIIGNVKNEVESMVGNIGMGIPSVVYGRKFTTRNAGSNWVVAPFACEGAHIWVKVCLNPPSSSSATPELSRARRLMPA